jgi:hypothetical protein
MPAVPAIARTASSSATPRSISRCVRQQHGQLPGQRQPLAELLQVTVGLGDEQVTHGCPFLA